MFGVFGILLIYVFWNKKKSK